MHRAYFVLLSLFMVCTFAIPMVLAQTAQNFSSTQNRPSTQLALATPLPSANLQALRSDASVLLSGAHWVAAADAYRRLIQLGSNEASDRYALGDALYHAKDLRNAAQAFQQALTLNPRLDQCYARLAETHLALQQRGQARQVCIDALQKVSDSYSRQQLEMLLKVSSYEIKPPTRSHEIRLNHMPSES